jgi:hypothetical protein
LDTDETIVEDTGAEFNMGTMNNVTIDGNTLLLRPGLGFQIQNNGKSVLPKGTGTDWDRYTKHSYTLKVNSTYYMYYPGGTSGWKYCHIGVATSDDGINWKKYSGNPILSPRASSGDSDRSYSNPYVYYERGSWYMYYSTWRGDGTGWDICMATSDDGFNWTKNSSNPVINNRQQKNVWNFMFFTGSILNDSGTYRMYFYAFAQSGGGSQGTAYLCMATSNDLEEWTTDPNNPGRKGDTTGWEKKRTFYHTVENSSGSYRLWSTSGYVTPNPWFVGWLRSDDAKNFVDSGRTVFSPKANTIYAKGIWTAYVVDEGNYYLMFASSMDANNIFRYPVFKVTPNKLDGTYTSKVFDALGVVEVQGMNWKKNVTEGGIIDLSFRWSNDSVTWSTWQPVSNNSVPSGATGRYFQYKAAFQVLEDGCRIR